MATFDDSAGYAEPLPVAHRHPGARVARRADKRPAAAFLPESRKKCGHCQDMKPCVEFSADVSRGDGLRGWCKMCEAEARSNRYKKRKAAAIEHSVSRRRLEQPLGGLPSYHSQQQQQPQPQQRVQGPPPPGAIPPHALQRVLEMYAQQNPGAGLPPHLQQLLQQAQLQQHAAMLDQAQSQAQRQQPPPQQQQQPALPLALLQQQMAAWQAQKAVAARAATAAAADGAPQQYRSAFHPVSPSPQGLSLQQPASAAAISAALGGALNGSGMSASLQGRPQHPQQQPIALPSGEALAAYLAAEAATGNINSADSHASAQTLASIVPRLMPGLGAAMVHEQAAAAKAAAAAAVAAAHRPASPATSDSELSAGEILTGMKHHGSGGGGGFSPWGGAGGGLRTASASRGESQRGDSLSQRREAALWRGSAGSEDSGLVSVAAAAAARPPSELQVPRRSRTRPPAVAAAKPDRAAAVDRATAVQRAAAAMAAAAPASAAASPPASPPRQAAGSGADAKQPGVTHFSSQFLALLLTMRAVAFNSSSSGQRSA